VPPGGGGALVAAAPLRTLPRAFVQFPPNLLVGPQHAQKPKSRSRAPEKKAISSLRASQGAASAQLTTRTREIPSQGSRLRVPRSAAPSRRVSAHLWCAPCANHSGKSDPFGFAHISEPAQLLNDPNEENKLAMKTQL